MTTTSQQVVPAWRFSLAVLLLMGLAALLIWRILSLQVLNIDVHGHDFLVGQGEARTIRTETIAAYRGVISDRHGEPLAVSTPVTTIWFNPKHLIAAETRQQKSTTESNRKKLASALGVSRQYIEQKIEANKKRGFAYLRRHMPPASAKEVLALGIPGVYGQREYKRFYPSAEVAAQLVGFTNIDDVGQEGVELAYDEWLRGESGSRRVVKDLRGNIIRDIEQTKQAHSGNDLALSIDLRLQYLAHRELKSAMQRTKAKAGSVVMLDIKTGEVLAMTNQPAFNPNNRRHLNIGSIRNLAMTDTFEPGSTIKPFTVVAALESGKYQPDTLVDTNPGYIRVGKKILKDVVNYGVIDVTKIITKSSQVGTSKLALSLDEQSIWKVLQRVGFGVSSGSGFPGESGGFLPGRSHWQPIDRVNLAFGYGISVTSLQLAQAYSVLASGGVLRPATLIRQDQVTEGERVISADIARKVVAMLQTVTEKGGTGTQAQVSAYTVAGKTGTVHKFIPGKGYSDDRYIAVFAGLAPVENPRLVTVVMIDEPRNGKYYGGEAAAPVFSKVMADALRLLDVVPDKWIAMDKKKKAQTREFKAGGRKSV